jgi:flagellar FliL protein
MAEEELEGVEGEAEKGGSKKKLIIIIAGGLVAALLIAGAGLYFTGFFDPPPEAEVNDQGEPTEASDKDVENTAELSAAVYQDLTPPFIVNFQSGNIKIMKIAISLMTRNDDVVDAIKQHDPVIRNNTLLLLASQNPEELKSTEGKLALQTLIKDDLNKILKAQKVSGSVEQVFFTDLVMQ